MIGFRLSIVAVGMWFADLGFFLSNISIKYGMEWLYPLLTGDYDKFTRFPYKGVVMDTSIALFGVSLVMSGACALFLALSPNNRLNAITKKKYSIIRIR